VLDCPKYYNQRSILLNELSWYNNKSIHTFLFGDINLDENSNISL